MIFDRPETADSSFFSLTFENDVFVGEDNGYTNGLGFTYGRGPFLSFSDDNLPYWLNALSRRTYIHTMPDKVRGVAYMFFQNMHTPTNMELTEMQSDDVPYAGLVALQTTLYAWDRYQSDRLSLYVGVVGPAALAGQSQKSIHKVIGGDDPKGWGNQLDNELVIKVEAKRLRKIYQHYGEGAGIDIIGIVEAGVGNLESAVSAGVAMRWGTNMEYSHATFGLESDRHVNALALSSRNDYYGYLGAAASVVLNDILIDGNTFSDSHSAPLEHSQDQLTGGVVWKYGSMAYVFQLSSFSSRTSISSKREKHGALSLTFVFD